MSTDLAEWKEFFLVVAMAVSILGVLLLAGFGTMLLIEWFWNNVVCDAVVCK